jgi:hypothetical protein
MTQDNERALFEQWLGRETFTERNDSGKYESAHVDAMWSAWQAARTQTPAPADRVALAEDCKRLVRDACDKIGAPGVYPPSAGVAAERAAFVAIDRLAASDASPAAQPTVEFDDPRAQAITYERYWVSLTRRGSNSDVIKADVCTVDRGITVAECSGEECETTANRICELLNSPAQPSATAWQALAGLLAEHAKLLEGNPYCYFELAYTRSTGWMAWITDKPAKGEPGTAEYAKSRKVIARGQGDTPEEAAADALCAITAQEAPE